MALNRYVIKPVDKNPAAIPGTGAYGQLELNQVAFRRDGRIEAQCKLDETDFATIPCENGMLLAVDNVKRIVKFPVAGEELPVALVYTTEHMYDERYPGLRNFALFRGSFLPRLGYPAIGDKFTTNTFAYDTTDFADDEAVEAMDLEDGEVYAAEGTTGVITLKKGTVPTNAKVVLRVIKVTTMPDGTFGLKFQVIK